MATHALFDSNETLPSQPISGGVSAASARFSSGRGRAAVELEQTDSIHSANLAVCGDEESQGRRLRRKMTREQGSAIEKLGHAVDYLNDCHFYEGADDDILDLCGSWMEAAQLLISAQRQVLESVPLTESRSWRLLGRLRHGKS